jgi:glycosyltransferase involved in cell wall biosynthesis
VRRWRVTGPFKGITGYDRVVRSIVPELRRRGVEVELRDLPEWSPTQRTEKLPPNLQQQRIRSADLHLHFGMPPQVVCSPDCPNVNYSMFEADRIPPAWAAATETIDLAIVPTESSRLSWIAGGVPAAKVAVCPEGADFELFSPGVEPLELRTRDGRAARDFRCRFLNVGEFIARKNLGGLLRVWLRETRANDAAVLILKPGFYAVDSRRRFDEMVRRLENETGRRLEDAAPLLLCDRQLDEAEMPRLYAAASHYWSMSFGEGFDLPMMESAACDLQLIAPRHSSYLHYLRPEHAFLLPVEAVDPEIPGDPGLAAFFQGSKWWRPDEAAAAETIRGIIDGRALPRQSARQSLMADCSWGRMADRLIRVVDEHREQIHGVERAS